MTDYLITAGNRDGYFIRYKRGVIDTCNQFTNFLTWWQFGYEQEQFPRFESYTNTGFVLYTVDIPKGAKILSAKLIMHINASSGSQYAPYTIQYRAIKEVNTSVPSTCANADAKPRTVNVVSEYIAEMPDGIWYESMELSSIVQEVIDLPNWIPGNLMFYLNMSPAGYNYEYIDSYENSPSLATILRLSYIVVTEEMTVNIWDTKYDEITDDNENRIDSVVISDTILNEVIVTEE
jgi:hypothetical protein